MKKWMKKVGLVAASIVTLTTLLSAGPANANVSRVEYFNIVNAAECGKFDTIYYVSGFNLSISNASDVAAQVTLYLYTKDGTLITENGGFTPGQVMTIDPLSTVSYLTTYGALNSSTSYSSCSNKPALGKIVVNSNSGLILASGSATASRSLYNTTPAYLEMYRNSPVIINEGNPF